VKIKGWLKSDKNITHFTRRPMYMCRNDWTVFIRMRKYIKYNM
jgi:hypothetical protein